MGSLSSLNETTHTRGPLYVKASSLILKGLWARNKSLGVAQHSVNISVWFSKGSRSFLSWKKAASITEWRQSGTLDLIILQQNVLLNSTCCFHESTSQECLGNSYIKAATIVCLSTKKDKPNVVRQPLHITCGTHFNIKHTHIRLHMNLFSIWFIYSQVECICALFRC